MKKKVKIQVISCVYYARNILYSAMARIGRRQSVRLIAGLSQIMLLVACTSLASTSETHPALAEELTIYGWEGYMPQSVLDKFTAEYDVAVRYVTYDSAADSIEAMRRGDDYDVIVVDNLTVPIAAQENLLAELDYRNIPNFEHVAADFRDLAFDPHNRYSVPFQWGTTGILYRTDLVKEPIMRWADLWNPVHPGKIFVGVNSRNAVGISLKILGYSFNSEEPEEIALAGERLMEIKDKLFFQDPLLFSGVPYLLSGEVQISGGYTFDMQREEEMENIAYIIPEEGTVIWMDNLVIPANSAKKYTAELFLNFILRPEIGARIATEAYVAVPNQGAYAYIDPAILNNPLIFPKAEDLVNAEFYEPISPEAQAYYDEIWANIVATPQ